MGREAAGRDLLRVFSMGCRRRSCPKIGWPFAVHPKLGQMLVLASRKGNVLPDCVCVRFHRFE